jgi:2-polyprenyl-3-methyl-5-hydroxy-6-metoxy-1,4-benzoquinol methylase
MDHYKETAQTWNKLANIYQDKFMDLDLYNETYDFFCDKIKRENAGILEIGCGPGNITRYLLSKKPDFDIFATDVAPNMIELAKQNCPEAKFALMDARDISQLGEKYDGIVCGFCLPFLTTDDVEKLISDCAQLLNQNGVIYISFMDDDPEKSEFKTGSTGDKVFFRFHTLQKLESLLKEHGFVKNKVFRVQYTTAERSEIHTILIALRT